MPRIPTASDGATGPAKPKRPSPKKQNGSNGAISSEDVAKRAYDLYLSRGCGHGADFDDWIEAERQLKQSAQAQPHATPERRKRPRAISGA